MSYRSVRPSVFASPIGAGGLGLQPPSIGKMLACEGVANGLFQIFFFKKIHDRLAGGNTRRLFLWCVPMSIPVFWMFPVMSEIAAWQGKDVEGGWRVYAGFAIQTMFFILFNMASGQSLDASSIHCTDGVITSSRQAAFSYSSRLRHRIVDR